MKRFLAVSLILLLTCPLWAELKIPEAVSVKPGRMVRIPATGAEKTVRWINTSEDADLIPSETGKYAIFSAMVPGRYKVAAYTTEANEATEPVYCVVTVEGTPPTPPTPPVPPGPNPPGPGPGPTPQPPGPVPIPDPGLRVLIVYETADLSKLPKEQLAILTSQAVRAYLSSHCAKGPDSKTPEWRIFDQNVSMGNESALWQGAMKRPRTALPWIVISNGTIGYEGPLPANVDETLALLKKFGG